MLLLDFLNTHYHRWQLVLVFICLLSMQSAYAQLHEVDTIAADSLRHQGLWVEKGQVMMWTPQGKEKVVVVINGVLVTPEEVEQLAPATIKAISILWTALPGQPTSHLYRQTTVLIETN